MRIAEIYSSLQGEGTLTGTPSVFVRASGCNLRCWFCDTPYTSWQPEGEDWSVEEVMREVQRLAQWGRLPACQNTDGKQDASSTGANYHVVITGGEPMLFSELIPLTEQLHELGLHITIETAGTLFLPVVCDLMSISPKLASSTPTERRAGRWSARHEQTRMRRDVIQRLTADYDYQLKFVIDKEADVEEVSDWLAEFPKVDRSRVHLMPQGTDTAYLAKIGHWLLPYCQEHGFTFCPRKHVEWYGARRGT
jgi:7-carboxy-7-deazaguanine synthase